MATHVASPAVCPGSRSLSRVNRRAPSEGPSTAGTSVYRKEVPMAGKKSTYTSVEHARARAMFQRHQRTGTLKSPPGIMSGYANGRLFSVSESVTRYEHYLPDARRALRRSE